MRSPVHGPVYSWQSVPPLECVLIIIPSTGENSGGDSLPHLISTALLHSPSLLPHKASTGEPPPETRICAASVSCLLRHSQVAEEVAVVGTSALAVGHWGLPITGSEGLVCSGVDLGWRALRVPAVLQLMRGGGRQMFFLRKLSLPRFAGPPSSGKGLGCRFLFVSRIMVFLFF